MNDLIEVYNPITGEKTYVSEEKMAELAMHFNSMIHEEPIKPPQIVKRSSGRYPWGKERNDQDN